MNAEKFIETCLNAKFRMCEFVISFVEFSSILSRFLDIKQSLDDGANDILE
jgi:hypothetical protein